MKIKSVLFDMDGVIVDSEEGAFDIFRKSLNNLGVEISLSELLNYTGKTSHKIAVEIIERYGLKLTPKELIEHNRKTGNYYRDSEDMKEIEGLSTLLEKLKNDGISMAVVSSTSSKNVLTVLNRLSLLSYFNAVICGDMVKEWKPSPEGYLKAAEYLNSAPNECVVIEDSSIGIQAGITAGMTVIGFKGSVHKQKTDQAHLEVYSYRELLEQPLFN